jgi:nitrite reductase (NADH) small subunit
MNDWTPICRVDDIPVLGARRVRRPAGADVAVFRTADDRVFALLDRCPHKGGPLSQGIVFGEQVACPLHNWAISLVDGQARAPDIGCATRFAVDVDAGQVSLLASELATLGVDDAALAGVDPATARRMTATLSSGSRASSPSDAAPPLSSCAKSQDPRFATTPIVSA